VTTQHKPWIAGVDGCRAGWLAVLHEAGRPETAQVLITAQFADVLARPEPIAQIAIDIPIGLPERTSIGGRPCDGAARAGLGARQSSVFSVPARAAVYVGTYTEACRLSLEHSDPPRKVSKQVFNLFAKIREVDSVMTPELQRRVVECHPERVFLRLNGGVALMHPKKIKSRPNPAGLTERQNLLAGQGYSSISDWFSRIPQSHAGPDDIIDAFANAAAAAAILSGTANRVPAQPDLDPTGLRMEIWG
jgi:predicted RNase H-like nuclease